MSIMSPEIEIVDRNEQSIRFLEHGWPSDLCRWHAHEECELHLLNTTGGKAFVGDFIGDFAPGSLYLTGPNLPHNWVTNSERSGRVEVRDRLIQFNLKNLTGLTACFTEFQDIGPLLKAAQSGVEFHNFDPATANRFFDDMRDLTGSNRIVRFLSFLSELNQFPHKTTLSVVKLTQTNTNHKHLKIGEAIDFITRSYTEDLSVKKVADMVGMSEASFARYFQSATGNRFTEFVNRVRIGHACVMLFETEERISSVCFDVGFQNLANFNRQFLKMKGVTPGEYRLAARTNLMPKAKPKNVPEPSPYQIQTGVPY